MGGRIVADSANLDAVKEVLQQHKRELMERYQAEGVAIGKASPADDRYVIVVFLAKKQDGLTESAEVDGIPVSFRVTGRFEAQT